MSKDTYTPELGQMLQGNPWQQFEAPAWMIDALEPVREALIERIGDDPFSNTGEQYDNDTFSVHAYDWGAAFAMKDDGGPGQPWNFKYGDFEMSWYKRLGRGTTINRSIMKHEFEVMIAGCLRSLDELTTSS